MTTILLEGLNQGFEYRVEISLLLLGLWAGGLSINETGILNNVEGIFKHVGLLCAGFLPLTGMTFLISLLSLISEHFFVFGCYALALSSTILIIRNLLIRKSNPQEILHSSGITILFLLLLVIRLPYLNTILLPGYTDSPIHYQIIRQIISPTEAIHSNLAIKNILKDYYHFGYHGLAAWLSTTSGATIERSMSFIGQACLVLAPLSIAFAVYTGTKNNSAALCAGALAAFGWIMPSFAVNWGKFPALAALSVAPVLLGLAGNISKRNIRNRTDIACFTLLVVCEAIIHTRMVGLLFLLWLTAFTTRLLKIPGKFNFQRSVIYSLLFLISLLPLSQNALVYFNQPILGIVLALFLPMAFTGYPKETSGLFIFTAGIWGTEWLRSFAPNSISALDTQFINMCLFIPFSIQGGLSAAGGMEFVSPKHQRIIPFIILFATFYNSPWQTTLIPDPCCNYYTQDDEVAFQWIRDNTSKKDLFIISVIESGQKHGTDAGIWIYALTGRNTNKIAPNIKWKEGIISSCNSGELDIYVYSGGNQHSFSPDLLSNLNWMEPVFECGKNKIFKVSKCVKAEE